MRRLALVCLLVVACRPKKAPPLEPSPPTPPSVVVEKWNTAHGKHDVVALQGLYAAHVEFYGQTITNAEVVASKKAAFAKSPDYAQTIRGVDVKADGTVQFTKTSTVNGKSTDYPAVLVVAGGLITVETDKVTQANLAAKSADTQWCTTEWMPNDKVRAPFKLTAENAVRRARNTKHFAARTAASHGAFLDFGQVGCPSTCGDRSKRECGFRLRLENHEPGLETTSNLVEWDYVDAMDGVLWWEEESGWKSEPLPPP